MTIKLRPEKQEDQKEIFDLNHEAFGDVSEARLVDTLRAQGQHEVSLVAVSQEEVIGHLLMSPVSITGCENFKIAGLAPMSVKPDYQRKGVGGQLVREGLSISQGLGYEAVVVLGHPDYYPRFGFEPAVNFGISSEYDVPEEVFMATELITGSLQGIEGLVKYHSAFAEA